MVSADSLSVLVSMSLSGCLLSGVSWGCLSCFLFNDLVDCEGCHLPNGLGACV